MSRPIWLEFPGAVYHVTSRGDRREPIYRDDEDRLAQLSVIAQAAERFDAQVLAYCLMGIHYHPVLRTRAASLSRFVRHLNGVYAQAFNRRLELVGHLFQGRFKAIVVDRDAYLLALCRYVERNPVAAGLVMDAVDWPCSSCRAHPGRAPTPPWLDTDGLQGYLLARHAATAADRQQAFALYGRLLQDASVITLWAEGLRQQVFLGDEAFVRKRSSNHVLDDGRAEVKGGDQRAVGSGSTSAARQGRRASKSSAVLALGSSVSSAVRYR